MVKRHQKTTSISKWGAKKIIPRFIQKEFLFLVFLFLVNHLNKIQNKYNKNPFFHPPKAKNCFLTLVWISLCQFIVVAWLMEHWKLREESVLYYLHFLNSIKPSKRGNWHPKELPEMPTNHIGKASLIMLHLSKEKEKLSLIYIKWTGCLGEILWLALLFRSRIKQLGVGYWNSQTVNCTCKGRHPATSSLLIYTRKHLVSRVTLTFSSWRLNYM